MAGDVRFLLLLAASAGLVALSAAGWLAWYQVRLFRARRAWRRCARDLQVARARRRRETSDTRPLIGDSLLDAVKQWRR